MADEATSKTISVGAAGNFDKDDFDEGLDVNNLPALPWTRENLGTQLFNKLARVGGYGDTSNMKRAPLDVRSFGTGRANRLIELHGLNVAEEVRPVTATGLTDEQFREAEEAEGKRVDEANAYKADQIRAYLAEGDALQAAINEQIGASVGTARNPNAPERTPATIRMPKDFPRKFRQTSSAE